MQGWVDARRRVLEKDALAWVWVRSTHASGNGMGASAVWIPERVHADLKQEEIAGISSSLSSDNPSVFVLAIE
jgi:hypothetical protein